MPRLEILKVLIYQRLKAAVEDIIEQLERTITEYEEEMECRHRKPLDMFSESENKPHRADTQLLLPSKEGQQEWSPSMDPEDPVCPHIKKEKETLWTSQEGEQLQGHTNKFSLTYVYVKTEDDEEKSQSSQLHQRQAEEKIDAEPHTSSLTAQMKTEADGDDYGGSEQESLSGSDGKTSHSSEAVTKDSKNDWKEIRKPQSHLNAMKNKVPVNYMGFSTGNKLFSCANCGRRFGQKHHLQTHMRCHTGERPFSCGLCSKRFTQKGNLTQHLTVHTREKPCS